ncbi:hypothetical protein [Kroppenstedtia sanguinis]|uniref:Uncharacterized protein n=1 Tax=Kroppenstedtia sanguinis TaxID=1380684 RepID=A0ABW4CER6_9BACL
MEIKDLNTELNKVLSTLIELNEKSEGNILDQSEIKEQLENLEEFKDKSGDLYRIAESIDKENPKEIDKICELLLKLHFLFEDYMWQLDEIHELVKKMSGNYRNVN